MEEKYVDHSIAQLDTIKAAFEEQAETAKSAGWFVAAISSLVRPGITWSLFFMYAAVKVAAIYLAFVIASELAGRVKPIMGLG